MAILSAAGVLLVALPAPPQGAAQSTTARAAAAITAHTIPVRTLRRLVRERSRHAG